MMQPEKEQTAEQTIETSGAETAAPQHNETEKAAASDAPGGANDGASAYITALQAELEDARSRAEKAEQALLYSQSDFQNYRRRKEEEFKSQQKFLSENLLKEMLPIVDSFERALQAAQQNQSFDKLIGGVEGTLKQMYTFLQKSGVTPIESLGKEFDPNFHEAIGHTEGGDHPANTVAEEVQRGYNIHDRVLRPALVKVAQG